MTRVAGCLALLLACSSCLFTDARYTGEVKRCDNTTATRTALLVVDNPRSPTSFTGWWGVGDDSQRDTWLMVPIEEGTSGLEGLSFTVAYKSSGDAFFARYEDTQKWEVELSPAGNQAWEGSVKITVTRLTIPAIGTPSTTENTERCDVELSAED